MTNGKLYLIPTPLSEESPSSMIFPPYNSEVISSLDYFVVEDLRSARRFLSRMKLGIVIDDMTFAELSEHTEAVEVENMLKLIIAGRSAGIMSEAGVPGVADPGAELVAAAHRHDIEVIPLIGPSSILLALMASGANGQSFAFNGYIPVKQGERQRSLRELERAANRGQSQIFIETPYRNESLLKDIMESCSETTKLTIAVDITAPSQFIRTYTIKKWKTVIKPDLKKRPAIFILS